MPKTKPSGNFIFQCINKSLVDESCILGSSVLILSLILLVLNIYALIKMTKFYKKMNFENTIILLSIIQTILLQSVLITSYDIFFEAFFLVQIFIISLTIRKFIILAIEPKTFFDKNGIFVLLNLLNVVIFLIYPLYLNVFKGHHLYVKLFYRIFHAITTCILSYYCCYFIKLITKYNENYLNSYYFLYEASISNNVIKDSIYKNNNTINNTNDNSTNNDNDNNKKTKRKRKGEVFYHKKKKQIRYLYVVNLFCAFIEICFTIIRNFILYEHYLDDDYRTISNSTYGDLIYYFYLLVCFCNVSVNYLCFFFYIRHQYTGNSLKYLEEPEKKILDENFIEKENIKNSNNPEVNAFLFNNSSAAKNKDEDPFAVTIEPDRKESINSRDSDFENNEDALLPDNFQINNSIQGNSK